MCPTNSFPIQELFINTFLVTAAPPYWVEGGIKQYYVSKRCATRVACEAVKSKTMPYCTYLWYQDWKCAECCLGDRCNYYITVKTIFIVLTKIKFDLYTISYFRWEAVWRNLIYRY